MSAGATLLKLQQIDLELARNKSELANMPELKELASKRKTYVKLKSEMTKLYAQRKDLDIELDDLNTTEIQTNNAIEAAKKHHVDGSDYREVQDLENELATTLPTDVLTDYERLLKQFRGLAVETIQGNIPTICHTALQASSMSDLNHDGSEIAHCPYCHRLLVLPSKEA